MRLLENTFLLIAVIAFGLTLAVVIATQKQAKRDNERQLEMIQKKIAQKEKQDAKVQDAETNREEKENSETL